MSFWSSAFGAAKSSSTDFPSSQHQPQSTHKESKKDNIPPTAGPPPITGPPPPTAGPPPTTGPPITTAYGNFPQKKASNPLGHHHPQPAEAATPIPKFQIFQPKVEESAQRVKDQDANDEKSHTVVNDIDRSEDLNDPNIESERQGRSTSDATVEDPVVPLDDWTWDEQPVATLDITAVPIQQDVNFGMERPPSTINELVKVGKDNDQLDDSNDSSNANQGDLDCATNVHDDHDDHCQTSEEEERREVKSNDNEEEMIATNDPFDANQGNSDCASNAHDAHGDHCQTVDDKILNEGKANDIKGESLVISSTRPNPVVARQPVAPSPTILANAISPKFDFLITESIDQFKLEEDSAKRRHEFRTRFYQMDCRLAGLLARCVVEGAKRHEGLKAIFPGLCRQLEHVSDRYLGNKLQLDGERTRLLALQRRVHGIHTKMVKHYQETLHDLQEEVFESLHLEMLQNVQPSLQMEVQKADKRESTRFRKFESLAGTAARRFYEETATRKAAEALLREQIDLLSQPESKVNFLEQLRTIRAELQQEREARRARDAQVLSDVHSTCDALKRAVLEAADTSIG
ncbi:hypothetical protein MHU86_17222 [Fragilaria crotonensis]|nr:hypothetical protein MHU86_17222 [Fragilaria crotonensis]